MKHEDFRKLVIEPLTAYNSNINRFRLRTAYEDLNNIYELLHEFQTEARKHDVFETAELYGEDAVKRVTKLYSCLSTYFKALFIFADIFVSTLLSETTGKPGLTLNKFIAKPQHPLLNLQMNELLLVYCIVVYRNKVIAHHDVRRLHSFKLGKNDEDFVLVPMPEKFHITKENAEALLRLKSDYEPIIPNLMEKTNLFSLLKALFYGIPIGSPGLVNADRKEINAIVERGGCDSLNPGEVVEALDQFAIGVVNILHNAA